MMPSDDAGELRPHGGELTAARRLFADAPEPFIDLSTGINPHPYPLPKFAARAFARLPETAAINALAALAAKTYGAPSTAAVVPAPGTQILLPLVATLVSPGHAAIVAPTYSEFAPAAALAGHRVTEVGKVSAVGEAGLVIVANPNNPDGQLFAKSDLLALAHNLHAHGGMLVVDEAFMDVGPPDQSLIPAVPMGNIIVLRSFGKFFGLAGLRLGFALAAPALAARLKAALGPWAVSAPALAIGMKALADRTWIETTRLRLQNDASRLDAVLSDAGLAIIGGTTLFRLVQSPAAAELFHHLGCAGILVRRFPDHPTWLRFGLPANGRDWRRFKIAMVAFRNSR
ncbi:MAG TPA: threonine-phosphate decarboxylase CobD [Xanthobacteraceae bacterium]|jgi:cobalamin biosynthetic protein CobC